MFLYSIRSVYPKFKTLGNTKIMLTKQTVRTIFKASMTTPPYKKFNYLGYALA